MIETMNSADIAFPNLGIYLENVPKNFSVFGFSIAFYGLIIGIGVISGILMAAHEAKRTGQNPDDYWDFAIYAIIFSIIGARLYYVIFSWDHYKNNLLEILNLRKGGLAIYGAVIAAFITLFVYTTQRRRGFSAAAGQGQQQRRKEHRGRNGDQSFLFHFVISSCLFFRRRGVISLNSRRLFRAKGFPKKQKRK